MLIISIVLFWKYKWYNRRSLSVFLTVILFFIYIVLPPDNIFPNPNGEEKTFQFLIWLNLSLRSSEKNNRYNINIPREKP